MGARPGAPRGISGSHDGCFDQRAPSLGALERMLRRLRTLRISWGPLSPLILILLSGRPSPDRSEDKVQLSSRKSAHRINVRNEGTRNHSWSTLGRLGALAR